MSKTYTYDSTLLTNISNKYKDGADKMEDIIDEFGQFKSSFESYYDGLVKDNIYDSIASTLENHMKELKMCYENMQDYVSNTLTEMTAADKSLSNDFASSGVHSSGGGSHSGGHHGGGGGGRF